MFAEFQPRRRVAVVVTRDLKARAGRPSILSGIVEALNREQDVRVFRLHNVFELGSVIEMAGAVFSLLSGALRGRPLPLQCALYASRRQCSRIVNEIALGRFDAVYLDTVRCYSLLRTLRRTCPDTHLVTDFDDLLSRRMAFLSKNRMPFLTGHASGSLPSWMRKPVETWLSRVVTAYESSTLPAIENDAIALSDAIALLSCAEREMLARHHGRATSISVILPAVAVRAKPWTVLPRRFVFIGSDMLLQNRTAIASLVEKWCTLRPSAELHIYGLQASPVPQVPNVFFRGFVEDLAEVYQPGSIALVPALGSGGIKTKVAEAWAWGCPVLCNTDALEGFGIDGYPLELPVGAWDQLISSPQAHSEQWWFAAQVGHDFVRHNMAPEAFAAAWHAIMRLEHQVQTAISEVRPAIPLQSGAL